MVSRYDARRRGYLAEILTPLQETDMHENHQNHPPKYRTIEKTVLIKRVKYSDAAGKAHIAEPGAVLGKDFSPCADDVADMHKIGALKIIVEDVLV